MMSRISHTRSTKAGSRSISFGGWVGGGTTISRMNRARRRGEHVDAIAEIDRLLDRMRDEEHGRLRFLPQIDQQLLHVQPRRRIQGAERLVHEDDAGREDQACGRSPRVGACHPTARSGISGRRASRRGRPWRSTRAPARAVRAPASRGTRDRTRRCPRRSGCRTTCSPERPCCGPTRDARPACCRPAPCLPWPDSAGAVRR